MNLKKIIAGSLVLLSVTACQTDPNGTFSKKNIGTLTGAVGGAWLGSNVGKGKGNIAAIAGGTLLGAYLGNQIGASLDRADMAYYNKTSQTALESNQTGVASSWSNPDSGNGGTITPTKTYQTSSGSHCREYTQTINVGGKTQQGYGTACRQPDGSWQIMN